MSLPRAIASILAASQNLEAAHEDLSEAGFEYGQLAEIRGLRIGTDRLLERIATYRRLETESAVELEHESARLSVDPGDD